MWIQSGKIDFFTCPTLSNIILIHTLSLTHTQKLLKKENEKFLSFILISLKKDIIFLTHTQKREKKEYFNVHNIDIYYIYMHEYDFEFDDKYCIKISSNVFIFLYINKEK